MILLDSSQVNVECQAIVSRLALLHFTHYSDAFNMLHQFGFRVHELYKWQFWIKQSDGTVKFGTGKGGNDRFIDYELLPLNIQQTVDTGVLCFLLPSYRVLSKVARTCRTMRCQVGGKSISTHIFRHNKMKQMSENGSSYQDIQLYMGLSKLETVNTYVNSRIYSV